MRTPRRLAALTATTALLVAVPVGAMVAPAHAAGRSWTTIATYSGAKHQACKELVNDGATWRIYNRLVNGNQAPVGAGMMVLKDKEPTSRVWDSGLIARGHTSDVGSVSIPKGNSAFTLQHSEHESQSGTGGIVGIGSIGRC